MSDIAGKPCGGTPASNIAVGGGTREEGGKPPLKERGDMAQWPTPLEAAEKATAEATAEARAGNAGVREGRRSVQRRNGDKGNRGKLAQRAWWESMSLRRSEGGMCVCVLPNGDLNKHPLETHQRVGDTSRTNKRTAVTPIKRPWAVAASHPTTAKGGSPTQTGQHVVNNDKRLAGGRGGWATRGGVLGRESPASQRRRITGRPRGGGAPGTAIGGWSTPLATTQYVFVRAGWGAPPQRKAWTCRVLPLLGDTCRCRKSMDNSLTTKTGRI